MTCPEPANAFYQTTSYRTSISTTTTTQTHTYTVYTTSTVFVTTSKLVSVISTQREMTGPYVRIEPTLAIAEELPPPSPLLGGFCYVKLTLRVINRMNVTITKGKVFMKSPKFDQPFTFGELPWLSSTLTQTQYVSELVPRAFVGVILIELDRAEIEWEKVQPNIQLPVATTTYSSITTVTTVETLLLSYTLTDVTVSPAFAYQTTMIAVLVASLLLLLVVRRRRRTRTKTQQLCKT